METHMDDMRSLKALQLDALREVANIGAGHAATALSQMINSTIMISVPTINVSRLEEVPPRARPPISARWSSRRSRRRATS
jgi:chemotaxis protein CheC